MVSKGDFMFMDDLEKGYRLVKLNPNHRNVLVYIDDFFICHMSEHLAIKSRNFLIHTLIKCSWLLSVPKHEQVAQKKVFLGLVINSLTMKFEIPDSKLAKFLRFSNQLSLRLLCQ